MYVQHEYAAYAQDSWKVLPNLTVDFGLRYEFNGVPFERNGNLSNLFQYAQGSAPFTFSLVGPGPGNLLYNNDWKDFEPRFGFSWDPTSTRQDGHSWRIRNLPRPHLRQSVRKRKRESPVPTGRRRFPIQGPLCNRFPRPLRCQLRRPSRMDLI